MSYSKFHLHYLRRKQIGKELAITNREFRETWRGLPTQFCERWECHFFQEEFRSFREATTMKRLMMTVKWSYYYYYSDLGHFFVVNPIDSKHRICSRYRSFSSFFLRGSKQRKLHQRRVCLNLSCSMLIRVFEQWRRKMMTMMFVRDYYHLPSSLSAFFALFGRTSSTQSSDLLQWAQVPTKRKRGLRPTRGETVCKAEFRLLSGRHKFANFLQPTQTVARRWPS